MRSDVYVSMFRIFTDPTNLKTKKDLEASGLVATVVGHVGDGKHSRRMNIRALDDDESRQFPRADAHRGPGRPGESSHSVG